MVSPVTGQDYSVRDSVRAELQAPGYDRPVNPNLYLIRPGEHLTFTFLKTNLSSLSLLVNAEGMLVHPTLGIFDLRGMTLAQVRQKLQDPLARQYNAKDINISVGPPLLVTVSVLGAVERPGTYIGWTSQRVSDMIAAAGGLTPDGSSRRITFSGGPVPVAVDLDRATFLGQDTLNPRLYAGYRIEIPYRTNDRVQVIGEVQRPREIELMPDDSVASLLKMAGGISRSVVEPVVELLGQSGRKLANGDKLSSGDIIGVRDAQVAANRPILVMGEVNIPGQHASSSGMTLAQAIQTAGGVTSQANQARITVFRLAESEEWDRTNRFRYAIDGITSGSDMMSFPLRAGDSVFVPRTLGFVRVEGMVTRPAIVPYQPGKTIGYYVNAAGGFLPKANRSEVNLSNRITSLSTMVAVSTQVQDGDLISAVPAEVAP
jgi:protein involved in polysaccharide export with SLBB domain